VYDPILDRMVVFGGTLDRSAEGSFNQTWALPLSGAPQWQELSLASAPNSRWGSAAVFDSERKRMVVVGGWRNAAIDDCWGLSLLQPERWDRLLPRSPAV